MCDGGGVCVTVVGYVRRWSGMCDGGGVCETVVRYV